MRCPTPGPKLHAGLGQNVPAASASAGNTKVLPEAGLTGVSVLTAVVKRSAQGDHPYEIQPLFSSTTLVPIHLRPDKIRPIAIGTALPRLVTNALLPQVLEDTREYLAPLQVANEIPCRVDSIVHKVRRLVDNRGDDDEYTLVPVDAQKAFNWFSRQAMIDLLSAQGAVAMSVSDYDSRSTYAVVNLASGSYTKHSQPWWDATRGPSRHAHIFPCCATTANLLGSGWATPRVRPTAASQPLRRIR